MPKSTTQWSHQEAKATQEAGGLLGKREKTPTWVWLVLGVLLLCGSHMRWGISLLAWVAPVPWLRYLRETKGWRSRLVFVAVFLLGWTLVVMKIATAPISLAMAPVFGVPIGLVLVVGYLVWDGLRARLSRAAAIIAFPAAMVCMEWLQHTLTPFGSWGAAAYTQVENLAWLQICALLGMAGLSFLLYWVAAAVEDLWVARRWQWHHSIVLVCFVLVGAWGSVRLSLRGNQARKTTRVAAISTDATFGAEGLPTTKQVAAFNKTLFARTRRAAQAGARLVVWNEGATMVLPKAEPRFQGELQRLAKETAVYLVAAYVVPIQWKPMKYENKYLWLGPKGQILQRYAKHKPVFGEPAIPGKAPSQVLNTPMGRMAGAICYDYDFPRVALVHAAQEAGLVFVPSSDWWGIHPYHTQMAALRAIEGGFSLLRSTRMGLSAGIDAYGRIRGWQSWFDQTNRVMLVELPTQSQKTLYSVIGDLLVVLCGCFLLVIGWLKQGVNREK